MSYTNDGNSMPGGDPQGPTMDAAVSASGAAASETATGSTYTASPGGSRRAAIKEVWMDRHGQAMDGSPKIANLNKEGTKPMEIPNTIPGISEGSTTAEISPTYASAAASPPAVRKGAELKTYKKRGKNDKSGSKNYSDFATLAAKGKKKAGVACLGDFIPKDLQGPRKKKASSPGTGDESGAHPSQDLIDMDIDPDQNRFLLTDYTEDGDSDGSLSTSVAEWTIQGAFDEDEGEEVVSVLLTSTPKASNNQTLPGGVGRTPPQNLFEKKFSALKQGRDERDSSGCRDDDHMVAGTGPSMKNKRKRSERRQGGGSSSRTEKEENNSSQNNASSKHKSRSARKRDSGRWKDFTDKKIRESREKSRNSQSRASDRSSSVSEQPPDKKSRNTSAANLSRESRGREPSLGYQAAQGSKRPDSSSSQQKENKDSIEPEKEKNTLNSQGGEGQGEGSSQPAGLSANEDPAAGQEVDNADPDELMEVETYADKMKEERKVVILHSARSLDMNDFIEIQGLVADFLMDDGRESGPKIEKAYLREGVIILYCENKDDVEVFKYSVSRLEMNNETGCNLKALDHLEAKNYMNFCCRVSDPAVIKDYEKFAKRLLFYNIPLRNNYFAVIGDISKPKDKYGAILKVRGDAGFLKALQELNMSPSYGFGKADFWPMTKRTPNNNHNKKKKNDQRKGKGARAIPANKKVKDGEKKKKSN